MDAVANSNELTVFHTDLIKDLIDFKWESYALAKHRIGAIIHCVYSFLLWFYVADVFLADKVKDSNGKIEPIPPNYICLLAFCVCLVYPVLYEFVQMYKYGLLNYMSNMDNYVDLSHIIIGYFNVFC